MKRIFVSSSFLMSVRVLAITLVIFVGFFGLAFGVFAANEQSATVIGGPYPLSGAWGGVLNLGSSAEVQRIDVTHSVGTAEGSLVLTPSDTLTFSSVPTNPKAVLDKGIFNRNDLVGRWANSLGGRSDCSADPSIFTIGADQYAFVLCGAQPTVSLSSSNNATMSCSNMTCVANSVGSTRITATLVGTPTKIWGQKNGDGWIELVSSTLPGATLSWDVSVVAPPTITFVSSGTNPIPYGTGVTLSWSAENVIASNPCVASGDWSGAKSASGTFSTGNLTARRDYTLQCTGPSGDTVDRIVTVLVGSQTSAPQFTFSADTTSVVSGGETTLRWNVSNLAETTGCEASGAWSGAKVFSGSEKTGSLFVDSTFVLICSGLGGSSGKQITIRVVPSPAAPDFRDFSADPDHILYNESTRLSWDVRNVTSCKASNDQGLSSWNGDLLSFSSSQNISNLTKTTTFTLECTGPGGMEKQSVTVRVEPQNLQPPSIVFFDADKGTHGTSLAYDESTTLRWRVDRADWCEASGDWNWWTDTYFDDWYDTGGLAASKSYTLHCENLAGSVEQTVVVSVNDPILPVVIDYFTANPSTIDYGGSAQARWNVQNAQWCYLEWWKAGIYQERINNFSFSGDETWGNLTQSERDVLTCGNSLGVVSSSVVITVNPDLPGPNPDPNPDPISNLPIISFTRDSGFISYNTATTLRWNVLDADSCEAWNDQRLSSWDGPVSLTGTTTTGNLRTETKFSLQCTGPGGTSSPVSVRVQVGSATEPGPSLSFWADRMSLSTGESTKLYWQSANATSCTASGDWSGSRALNNYPGNPSGLTGGFATGTLSENKTYRLRCLNSVSGAVLMMVTVFVGSTSGIPTPSLSFYADSLSVPIGGSTFLRWNAQNVKTCIASAISDPVASPFPTDWSGAVPLAGGRTTGNLPEGKYEYTLACTNGLSGANERNITLKTRVFSGSYSSTGPENVSIFPDATIIEFGTKPVLNYMSYFGDRCEFSSWSDVGPWTLLPALAGVVPDDLLGSVTSPTTYFLRCSNSDGFTVAQTTVRVGRVILCPASTERDVVPGGTLQFEAWYTEDSSAVCSNISALGGVNVTTTGAFGTTLWSVISGGVSIDNTGLVRGISSGEARIRVSHKPAAATATFSEEASVYVGLPIDCYRCDTASYVCSRETQIDFVNAPAQCTSDTYGSPTSCRFACFKDRWQEVAP